MTKDRDIFWLGEAIKLAAKESTDPSTQNGALIVPTNGWLSPCSDANRFPDGVKTNPERWERPTKYSFVEHAERNSIFKAAKTGISTFGATMYCPWFACADCARAIVQAGIKRVVGIKMPENDEAYERWKESCKIGDLILDEGGVERVYVDHHFGIKLLRDGKLIEV